MIEAHCGAALEVLELRVETGLRRHSCAEMHRRPTGGDHAERAALIGHLDPARRQSFRLEEMSRLFQLFFRKDPEADAFALMRRAASLDNQTVVSHLFQPAKIGHDGSAVAA